MTGSPHFKTSINQFRFRKRLRVYRLREQTERSSQLVESASVTFGHSDGICHSDSDAICELGLAERSTTRSFSPTPNLFSSFSLPKKTLQKPIPRTVLSNLPAPKAFC